MKNCLFGLLCGEYMTVIQFPRKLLQLQNPPKRDFGGFWSCYNSKIHQNGSPDHYSLFGSPDHYSFGGFWSCYNSKIHQNEKPRFFGTSRYKFKLRFWFDLNLYRGMRFLVWVEFGDVVHSVESVRRLVQK